MAVSCLSLFCFQPLAAINRSSIRWTFRETGNTTRDLPGILDHDLNQSGLAKPGCARGREDQHKASQNFVVLIEYRGRNAGRVRVELIARDVVSLATNALKLCPEGRVLRKQWQGEFCRCSIDV